MNKIIINDKIFTEAPFPITNEPSILEKRRILDGISRESIRITITATYSEVAEYFVNGANWAIEETIVDDMGAEVTKKYNKSAYSVAGDIIDHRNGNITVYMSKPTEIEKAQSLIEIANTIMEAGISVKPKPATSPKRDGYIWKPVLNGNVVSWEEIKDLEHTL